MCRRQQPLECASCPAADAGRMTSSTPPRPPASLRSTGTRPRSWPRTRQPCSGCSTSAATTSSHTRRVWSTSCTRCCETYCQAAATGLTAAAASRLLTSVRPVGPGEVARKQLARDVVTEIRDTDHRIKAVTKQIAAVVAETASRLTDVAGVGPVIAGRLLGRTRRASRFPAAAAFANYAGVAPVEVASADRARHRLSRGCDRQLNLALHIVAVTQVRMRDSAGRAYYDAKTSAGKTHNEAMRCLKRRLADHLWRLMIQDERRAGTGSGGHPGATTNSSATGSTPTTNSSEKSLPEPADSKSTSPRPAA